MKKLIVFVAMAASVSGSALAHGNEPKHGGIVKTAEDLSFELVNKDGVATIYVYDHGHKRATKGATGKMTILKGTDKSDVVLEPSQENALVTKGEAKLEKGAKAIASITFADKKTVNVRFSVNK